MSAETSDALDAAIRAHIADETGGDIIVGWAMVAGVVEHDVESKTSFLSTRGLARYEAKGLLFDAVDLLGPSSRREG